MDSKKNFRNTLGSGRVLAAQIVLSIAMVLTLSSFNWLDDEANSNCSVMMSDDDNTVYVTAEKMPEFPGGSVGLHDFLEQNVRYPAQASEEGIEGRVYVQFVIEKDGEVMDVHVARKCSPLLDAEAVRVVKSMPAWNPGVSKGKSVRVVYTVPISFKLR